MAAAGMALMALLSCTDARTGDRAPEPEFGSEAAIAAMRAVGKLRTEIDPEDAPYSSDDLVRDFQRIALSFSPEDGAPVASPVTKRLGPVRYKLRGLTVEDADRTAMTALAERLAEATGLAFAEAEDDTNLDILIVGLDEQPALLDEAKRKWGRGGRLDVAEILRNPDCGFVTFSTVKDPYVIDSAIVYVRAGMAAEYREQCLHEEVAQSLGLFDDDPAARPSIFNDDEEFALLTKHDIDLLRILYDPRVKPGMEGPALLPIVRGIAETLRPPAAE